MAVRTLVVTVSPLLTELVIGMLQPHFALDIVGALKTRDGLTEKLRAVAPDLVLLGLLATETDDFVRSLLVTIPLAQVLALPSNGQHAWLYEMRPRRTVVTNLSAAALTRVLKVRLGPLLPV
jgi:chemotaxis response regulator CheB